MSKSAAKKQQQHTKAQHQSHPQSQNKPQQQQQTKSSQPSKSGQPSKSSAPAKQQRKERGWLLITALILVGLYGLVMIPIYWSMVGEAQRTIANWAISALVLSSIADVIAAVAMWFWKMWGVYLFSISAIVAAVAMTVTTGSLLFLFAALLPAIIVLYIVMAHRPKFESASIKLGGAN